MDDNHDLQEGDVRQKRRTRHARDEYARSIGRHKKMSKKEIHKEKQDLVLAAEDKVSVLSLLK